MKLIRISELKVGMPKRQAKKLVAMPKQSSKKKIAMPFPEAKYPKNFKERNPELENRFEDEIDIGPYTDENGKEKGKAKYLGKGMRGIAYDIGSNKVIKVSPSSYEYEIAKKIMELQEGHGGPLPCVVNIYGVEKVSDVAYKITSEKVRRFNAKERSLYDNSYNILLHVIGNFVDKLYFEAVSEKELIDGIKKYREKRLKGRNTEITPEIEEMMFKLLKFIKCLSAYRLPQHDLHNENVGFREDGSLVLLDIG